MAFDDDTRDDGPATGSPAGTPIDAASVSDVVKPSPTVSSALDGPSPSDFLPDPKKRDQAIADTTAVVKAHEQEVSSTGQTFTQQLLRDRNQYARAVNEEAMSAHSLPPEWNADKERQERIQGPFERFGSAAVIFAGIASAFTKQPLTSALNASAAAMNSIAAHDEAGYEKAYTAWKDNTQLALKRFDMQHKLVEDSEHLFHTDVELWRAKQLEIAARFGDQQRIAMLKNGYDPMIFEMDQKRLDVSKRMQEALEQGEKWENVTRPALKAGYAEVDQAVDPKQNPALNADARALVAAKTASEPGTLTHYMAEAQLEYILKNEKRMPDEEVAQTKRNFDRLYGLGGSGGNPNLTSERQIADAVGRKIKEWRAQGLSEDEINKKAADLRKQLKQDSTPTGANARNKEAALIGRYDAARGTIDKIEELLKKHGAMTGLGGTLTRPAEVVGNWFGSDETDRAEFASLISEVKQWEGRLLNESQGRPLSSEAQEISKIVRGLSPGDTTKNTARRLLDLQELFAKLRASAKERWEGTWTPEGSEERFVDPPKPGPKGNFWEQDEAAGPK